jgi:hypothetical protein
MSIAIVPQEKESLLATRAKTLLADAQALVVDSDAGMERAADFTRMVKTNSKQADELRRFLVDPQNKAVKEINERFKTITSPLDEAERVLKGKMLEFTREQERQRLVELERQRKEADERALAEAVEREAAGDVAAADTIVEAQAATTAPEPVKAPPTRTISGTIAMTRKVWRFRVVDLAAVPVDFLQINQSAVQGAINQGARQISGLEIYQDGIVAVR